jgi:hypothetical protein
MNSWESVQRYVDLHSLPYKVIRFNMSLRGVLVSTWNGETVANSIREAVQYFKSL